MLAEWVLTKAHQHRQRAKCEVPQWTWRLNSEIESSQLIYYPECKERSQLNRSMRKSTPHRQAIRLSLIVTLQNKLLRSRGEQIQQSQNSTTSTYSFSVTENRSREKSDYKDILAAFESTPKEAHCLFLWLCLVSKDDLTKGGSQFRRALIYHYYACLHTHVCSQLTQVGYLQVWLEIQTMDYVWNCRLMKAVAESFQTVATENQQRYCDYL